MTNTCEQLVKRIDALEFIIINHATHNGSKLVHQAHPHNQELLTQCGITVDKVHAIHTRPEYEAKYYRNMVSNTNTTE